MGEILVLWSDAMNLNNDEIIERLKKKADRIYDMALDEEEKSNSM